MIIKTQIKFFEKKIFIKCQKCQPQTFRSDFKQSIAHEPKHHTENESEENDNRLVNERESVGVGVQSFIGCRNTTRTDVHFNIGSEDVFRIHNGDDCKETPNKEIRNGHSNPKGVVSLSEKECTEKWKFRKK